MPVLPIDRDKFRIDWVRRHHSYERKSYKLFKSALDEQLAPVIKYVKSYGVPSADLAVMLVSAAPIEAAYKECYVKIGTLEAAYTRRIVNAAGRSAKAIGFFSEAWRRLMELFYTTNAASRVTDVTDTTRERLRRILDEANEQGLTESQTADYIVDQLNDPAFNRNRGLVIARTESTTAANKGASMGNADADYETVKEWIGVADRNERPTHRALNGTQVDNNEDFLVGGEPAQYPGDVRLSAKEVIQCRCSVAYIPRLDERGLPVLK